MSGLILETERLFLRPWQESDATQLYETGSDPFVCSPCGFPILNNEEAAQSLLQSRLCAAEHYAIVRKVQCNSGQHSLAGNSMTENDVWNLPIIGGICLFNLQLEDYLDADKEADLVVWLNRSCQKRGYALEACRELLRHCFEELLLERVNACCPEDHTSALRLFKELGFAIERRVMNEPMLFTDLPKTQCHHVILRPMYQQNRTRRHTHMNYIETRSRIYCKEPDGTVTAEIEFPEITRGNYRIARLQVAPKWDGAGVRDELLQMAVKRIWERGGYQITSSDPFAKNWLAQHGLG